MSTSPAPSWPYCAQGADRATDPVGCSGMQAPGHTRCLAHLADTDRDAYLASLTPGADIDHRGTTFTKDLLDRLLNALRDPATGDPRLGTTRFAWAIFKGPARFESATFTGPARFESATFTGNAWFESATFTGNAGFGQAVFERSGRWGRWCVPGGWCCPGRCSAAR